MADKCKDCKYYDNIDSESGYCKRYPQIAKNDGREEHICVSKNEKACGEFETGE